TLADKAESLGKRLAEPANTCTVPVSAPALPPGVQVRLFRVRPAFVRERNEPMLSWLMLSEACSRVKSAWLSNSDCAEPVRLIVEQTDSVTLSASTARSEGSFVKVNLPTVRVTLANERVAVSSST